MSDELTKPRPPKHKSKRQEPIEPPFKLANGITIEMFSDHIKILFPQPPSDHIKRLIKSKPYFMKFNWRAKSDAAKYWRYENSELSEGLIAILIRTDFRGEEEVTHDTDAPIEELSESAKKILRISRPLDKRLPENQ